MNLTITDTATAQLHEHIEGGTKFVRLGVRSGGCSGMTYVACLDAVFEDTRDQVIHEDGILKVVAEKEDLVFLDGLYMDYSTDLVRPGFVLTNPNHKKSCGCGSSFSPDADTSSGCGSGCGGGCGS
ncbi:MAG: iron-sulfur cluster assembly accessory protein [Kiritimatiellia bacterium]|nr:iron-sulfur cluster assembly accessory protein [Kiritimatiellia bacterium]